MVYKDKLTSPTTRPSVNGIPSPFAKRIFTFKNAPLEINVCLSSWEQCMPLLLRPIYASPLETNVCLSSWDQCMPLLLRSMYASPLEINICLSFWDQCMPVLLRSMWNRTTNRQIIRKPRRHTLPFPKLHKITAVPRRFTGDMYSYHRFHRLNILEPQHDKTNKVALRPARSQISLGFRPDWVFAGRALILLVLSCRGSFP